MSAPVDVSKLVGETIFDQEDERIGTVQDLYAGDGADEPAWVTIKTLLGLFSNRIVFVPISRLKEEQQGIRVPDSAHHLKDACEAEPTSELSAEDEQRLRDHHGIGRSDQELRTDTAHRHQLLCRARARVRRTAAADGARSVGVARSVQGFRHRQRVPQVEALPVVDAELA